MYGVEQQPFPCVGHCCSLPPCPPLFSPGNSHDGVVGWGEGKGRKGERGRGGEREEGKGDGEEGKGKRGKGRGRGERGIKEENSAKKDFHEAILEEVI